MSCAFMQLVRESCVPLEKLKLRYNFYDVVAVAKLIIEHSTTVVQSFFSKFGFLNCCPPPENPEMMELHHQHQTKVENHTHSIDVVEQGSRSRSLYTIGPRTRHIVKSAKQ